MLPTRHQSCYQKLEPCLQCWLPSSVHRSVPVSSGRSSSAAVGTPSLSRPADSAAWKCIVSRLLSRMSLGLKTIVCHMTLFIPSRATPFAHASKIQTEQKKNLTPRSLAGGPSAAHWGDTWCWAPHPRGHQGQQGAGSQAWGSVDVGSLAPPAGPGWELQVCLDRWILLGRFRPPRRRTEAGSWALGHTEGRKRMDGGPEKEADHDVDGSLPGRRTVMASWTACRSRLSSANIQWGFTCCCLKTFFTCVTHIVTVKKIPEPERSTRGMEKCSKPTASWKLNNTICRLFGDTAAACSLARSSSRLEVSCFLSGERMFSRRQVMSSVMWSNVSADPSTCWQRGTEITVGTSCCWHVDDSRWMFALAFFLRGWAGLYLRNVRMEVDLPPG